MNLSAETLLSDFWAITKTPNEETSLGRMVFHRSGRGPAILENQFQEALKLFYWNFVD